MLFTIKNVRHKSIDQLRSDTLLNAYFIISGYTLRATDLPMDNYLQQQYDTSLKDMCVKLLLSLTYYENDTGELVLLFKDQKQDKIAQLITYGNGAIPGSKILKTALMN